MPSVFNHENSCWGVKRSLCDVFHYDYNEDLQSRKLTEVGIPPNSNLAPLNSSIHYSISSNGYYGYQPHNFVANQINENIDMDVEENATDIMNFSNANTSLVELNGFASSLPKQMKRKRNMPGYYEDNAKRMRQEEAVEAEIKPTVQGFNQCGGGESLCPTSRTDLHAGHHNAALELLRHTHGCEGYLYERDCDY